MSYLARLWITLLLFCNCGLADAVDSVWRGKAVREYIDWLIGQGFAIVYSSDLVLTSYTIDVEPANPPGERALKEILEPYGLIVTSGPRDSLLVVRASEMPTSPASDTSIAPEPLPEIVVASSRYSLNYEIQGSHTFLDRELTTRLPDIGDDAVRSIARLPGVAGGGVSTRNHVRGGLANEQLILIDGLRLYEPFHLKDFHALSSIVDQNAIASIDFYSAGYPVSYGDRMSGVIDISLRKPTEDRLSEVGLSLFNTHVFSVGRFGDDDKGDWLVTARRGNLDLVADIVNPDYGTPRYTDALVHAGWELSARTRLSSNFLFSYDKISVAELDGSEVASARYRNRVGWLKSVTNWSDKLSSSTILSATQVVNTRDAETNIPNTVTGTLSDDRDFRSLALRQDWKWNANEKWSLSAGADIKRLEAEYVFDSVLDISPPFDQILDNQPMRTTSIRTSPRGGQYAVYVHSRWRFFDKLILDGGVRWDQQTYTTAANDDQVSPRFGVLWYLDDKTDVRFGVGQYYQAQEINELQASDGTGQFYPAQRARHMILSVNRNIGHGMELRLEAYQKKYRSLMPRYENAFDPLVLIPELQIDRVRIDADGAVTKGVEFMLSGENDTGSTLWWLGYTWATTEDSLPVGSVPRSWDQTHMGQYGISWDWKQWSFSAAGAVHTGWPKTELIVDTVTNPDGSTSLVLTTTPRNSLRNDIFHTLDARASRRFSLSKGELTLFGEITNLYNRENPCCTSYSLSNNSAGNPVIVQKKGNWLPLVPSIGVIWQF